MVAAFAVSAPLWGVFIAMFTSVLPMSIIFVGMRFGSANDHHVTDIKGRHWVLPVSLAIVVVGLIIEILAGAPDELIAWLSACVAMLVVVAIVTIVGHWKVSVHTAVAAGNTVLLAMIVSPWLFMAFPVTAAIAWSRVYLGDHTRGQVIVGAALGAAVSVAAYLLLA
ncbi:phosphatase PAP2 family protein [Nocardia brasiliensis]|uniref:phosphatase PAP2 family protein n=1 Tax=Nocardia brasiliensis TaxID=37326 RepID=UPI003670D4D8